MCGGGVRGEVCGGVEWVKEKESNEMKKNEQTKIFWENQINDEIVKVCRRLTNQKQIRNSCAFVQIPNRKVLLFVRHFFSSLQGIVRDFFLLVPWLFCFLLVPWLFVLFFVAIYENDNSKNLSLQIKLLPSLEMSRSSWQWQFFALTFQSRHTRCSIRHSIVMNIFTPVREFGFFF